MKTRTPTNQIAGALLNLSQCCWPTPAKSLFSTYRPKGEELSVSKCGPVSTRKQTSRDRTVMSQKGQKQSLPPLDGYACFKGTSIWQFTPCFTNARATLPPSS